MDMGNSGSGIEFANHYNSASVDKTIALFEDGS